MDAYVKKRGSIINKTDHILRVIDQLTVLSDSLFI